MLQVYRIGNVTVSSPAVVQTCIVASSQQQMAQWVAVSARRTALGAMHLRQSCLAANVKPKSGRLQRGAAKARRAASGCCCVGIEPKCVERVVWDEMRPCACGVGSNCFGDGIGFQRFGDKRDDHHFSSLFSSSPWRLYGAVLVKGVLLLFERRKAWQYESGYHSE